MSIEEISWKNPNFQRFAFAIMALWIGYRDVAIPMAIRDAHAKTQVENALPTTYDKEMDSVKLMNQMLIIKMMQQHDREIKDLQQQRKEDTAKLDYLMDNQKEILNLLKNR
jgi:hypothetical protein